MNTRPMCARVGAPAYAAACAQGDAGWGGSSDTAQGRHGAVAQFARRKCQVELVVSGPSTEPDRHLDVSAENLAERVDPRSPRSTQG